MKRFLWSFAALALVAGLAACGGDDDDDSSSASGSEAEVEAETESEESAAADFCDVWPEVNSEDSTLADEPTDDEIAEARDAIERVRESAPEEIEDEIMQMADALDRLLEGIADGGDVDAEEAFGELFGLAFTVGPPIEAWMVDNCPDYDPSSGMGVEEDDGLGVLDIEQGELDDLRLGLMENDLGASSSSSGDEHEWTWYFDGDGDAALAVCEQASEQLADKGVEGTLVLHISTTDDTVLAVNESITPGDAGTCELA